MKQLILLFIILGLTSCSEYKYEAHYCISDKQDVFEVAEKIEKKYKDRDCKLDIVGKPGVQGCSFHSSILLYQIICRK